MAAPGQFQITVTELEKVEFSSGICSCTSFRHCCFGLFCTPCAYAEARSKFDDSNCCFNLFIGSAATRNIIREGYRIKGGCIGDILVSTLCGPCAAAQLLNEVDKRGMVTAEYGTSRSATETPWKFSLCSCFESSNSFLYGCLCPCFGIAQARSNFDGGDVIFTLFCFTPCLTRSVIREGYNIEGSCMSDIFCPLLCYNCTACQIINEVGARGKVTKNHVQLTPTQTMVR